MYTLLPSKMNGCIHTKPNETKYKRTPPTMNNETNTHTHKHKKEIIIIRLTKTSRKISECHERQIWKFSEWGEHHRTWPAFANHPKLWPKAYRRKKKHCENDNNTTNNSISGSKILAACSKTKMTTRKARKPKGNMANTFEQEIHC